MLVAGRPLIELEKMRFIKIRKYKHMKIIRDIKFMLLRS